ncbi:MAG TPA: M1 family aminopeptidase, partial [Pyrinomonadaceae bacterium]|nr:M1 family aminopeptidase [Pyrinomonadaceae bacterium]
AGVGRTFHADAADYEVTVEAPSDVMLFSSGRPAEARGRQATGGARENVRSFVGEGLRSFALVAGRNLRASEEVSAGVRVRSVYAAEHERVGRRVLGVAAEAVRVFASRFGAPPYDTLTIAEAPLVAGLGNVEFTGVGVVASAYYVDFDAPSTRNLPPLVREQRASVEDSLEFTVAHLVAHQWWGGAVGSDPERVPFLDEALAHWSALLYYQDVYGPERAAQASDDQLKGVYQIYRTFGGEDLGAGLPARQFRNSFQYAAVVSGKGALMFAALRAQLGEERFWSALKKYYEANRFEMAEPRDLQAAFVAEAPVAERRAVARTFDRWLNEKRGDEDIAPPNPELAAALGINVERRDAKDRNSIVRLGRFFWRQMTRIR